MNSSFSTLVPGLQIAVDSTSIGLMKECAYKYKLSIIDGWTSPRTSIHLEFGIFYHSATERYSHAKAEGATHDEALDKALAWLLEATWDFTLNRPWTTDDSVKNRFTLVRSVVWYLDKYQDDSIQTVILKNSKPAIELSFRLELPFAPLSEPSSKYILCGHLDRVGTMNGQQFISDKKTSGHTLDDKFFGGFSPDNQMSTYAFAARAIWEIPVTGIVIDAVQVAVTFSRFKRGFIPRTPEILDEWYQGVQIRLREIEQYALANFWPQNEKSCYGCEFREVCRKSPSMRPEFLKAKFKKRVWDPLQSRGDI